MFRVTRIPAMAMSMSLCCLILMASVTTHGADWPQYHGPNVNGVTDEAISLTDWSDGKARQVWEIATPNGFSSFAVAGGKVFTLVSRKGAGDTIHETCLALDAKTGMEKWAAELGAAQYDGGGDSGAKENQGGDGPRSTPSVDGDRIYVLDAHLTLYCFKVEDGEILWKKDILKDFEGRMITWQSAASPLIDGDLVFVAGGGIGQSLLAFDKNNGELVWKGLDEQITHATPVAATIHGVRQIVFFLQSGLVSVEAASGKELWRYPFDYSTSSAASPVVAADQVYCSAAYGIGAGLCGIIETDSGFEAREVWRLKNKLMNHWSTPVYKDGYLYGIFGHKKYGRAPLQCVELLTGEEKWSQEGFGPGNCILAGDRLVVLGDDGQVALVEATPESYRELTRIKATEGKCWSTPAYSDGRLYIRSTTKGVCLDVSGAQ